MQLSESHRQLLKTMLQYEIDNFLAIEMTTALFPRKCHLELVKQHLEERIQQLKGL